MKGVVFDSAKTAVLRDEAPLAYKDIRRVMKAQKDLVKTVRTLRPLINYKAA